MAIMDDDDDNDDEWRVSACSHPRADDVAGSLPCSEKKKIKYCQILSLHHHCSRNTCICIGIN